MTSVLLDDQGRVVGVATGPPRQGWVEAPRNRDLWRLQRAADGEWLEMTPRGAAIRDEDHAPTPPPVSPARQRLRALRGKQARDLTQEQLAQAVLDLAATL